MKNKKVLFLIAITTLLAAGIVFYATSRQDRKLTKFISGHTFKYQDAAIWMRFYKNHTGWFESMTPPGRKYWEFFWKVKNHTIIYGAKKSNMDYSKYVPEFKDDYIIVGKEELEQTKLIKVD